MALQLVRPPGPLGGLAPPTSAPFAPAAPVTDSSLSLAAVLMLLFMLLHRGHFQLLRRLHHGSLLHMLLTLP